MTNNNIDNTIKLINEKENLYELNKEGFCEDIAQEFVPSL